MSLFKSLLRSGDLLDLTHAVWRFRNLDQGFVGTFHKVSEKYMPLYVAEFQFRYNDRMNADIFEAAISGC